MRLLSSGIAALALSVGFSFAAEHSLILRFEYQVTLANVLSAYDVVEARQIPGQPIYQVNINSNLSPASLKSALNQISGLATIEDNQRGKATSLVSAAKLDQRPLLVLDDDELPLHSATGIPQSTLTYNGLEFLLQIYADYAWPWASGCGVKVAVIDSGIDMTHPFLQHRISPWGYDFVDGDNDPSEERIGLDSNGNGYVDEAWGHGTHVAGIISMIAPGVEIIPIRVVDSDGQANLFDIIAGLEHALYEGADVINLSLSIMDYSDLLHDWILEAKRQNVLIVTSAGNENTNQVDYPASENPVLTVTSLDINYEKSSFANFGPAVDVSAPGENILSTHPGGYFIHRSGTSMSAPMAAAEAALILQWHPNISFNSLRKRVINNTLSVEHLNPAYQQQLGTGIINAYLGL